MITHAVPPAAGDGAPVFEERKPLLFVNKKKQKNFIGFWSTVFSPPRAAEQKFFVTFFQKSNIFLFHAGTTSLDSVLQPWVENGDR